jgi:hypothetical protein
LVSLSNHSNRLCALCFDYAQQPPVEGSTSRLVSLSNHSNRLSKGVPCASTTLSNRLSKGVPCASTTLSNRLSKGVP